MPDAHELVRVVVINYFGDELTMRCVESLEHTEWPRHLLEIVVVDNGSGNGFAGELARRHPCVRLIAMGRNTGFAGGANAGIRAGTGGDLVALVNNDAIVTPRWLVPLVEQLRREPDVGGVSPKVLFDGAYQRVRLDVLDPPRADPVTGRRRGVAVDEVRIGGASTEARFDEGFHRAPPGVGGVRRAWCDTTGTLLVRRDGAAVEDLAAPIELQLWSEVTRRVRVRPDGAEPFELDVNGTVVVSVVPGAAPADVINNAGSRLVLGGFSADRGLYEVDEGQYDQPCDVAFFYGGAVVLRRALLDDVGMFDERLFLYYEDTDLSWRGRLCGWRFRYEPAAVVRHAHAASAGLGSAVFRHQNERNRLLVLTKCAPLRVAGRAYAVSAKQVVIAALGFVNARRHGDDPAGEAGWRARALLAAIVRAPGMLWTRWRMPRRVDFSDPMRLAEPH